MKETMTHRERLLCVMNGGIPDRVPWLECYVQPGMVTKLLGREVPEAHPNIRLGLPVHEVLTNLDNITFDLRPPLFAEMATHNGQTMVKTPWLKEMKDVERLREWLPDPEADSMYDGVAEFIEKKGDYAAVASLRMGISPVYNSMGYELFIENLMDTPEVVEAAVEVYCEWCGKVVEKVNTMGFDIIWFSEDIAFQDNPMVTLDQYTEYLYPHAKKIADKAKLPFIYHSDGHYKPLIETILKYKPAVLANLEPPRMDLFELKKEYGDRVCLLGNMDLHYTLTRGTVEETMAEAKAKILGAKEGGGYIFATANGLPNYCITENVLAMQEAIGKYGWYE